MVERAVTMNERNTLKNYHLETPILVGLIIFILFEVIYLNNPSVVHPAFSEDSGQGAATGSSSA